MAFDIKTGGRSGEPISVGCDAVVAASPKIGGGTKAVGELLTSPSVEVSERSVAERFLDARYRTAKATADNLVDTPRDRREKERHRKDEALKAERVAQAEIRADRNAALRREDAAAVSFV